MFVSEEWSHIRDIVKFKVQGVRVRAPNYHLSSLTTAQNIDVYLDDPDLSSPKGMPPFLIRPSTEGGLRMPPNRPRPRNPANPMVYPKSFMTKEEANEMKSSIFAQLEEFDRWVVII